jgi:hypothetical protein
MLFSMIASTVWADATCAHPTTISTAAIRFDTTLMAGSVEKAILSPSRPTHVADELHARLPIDRPDG